MAKWLDKYEQGGMVLKKKTKDNYGKRENPNDVQASVGPDFVGLGYNTKGRDYSPAWGGQFQNGGKLTLPEAIVYGHKDPSTKAYFNKVRAIAENYQDKNFWLSPLAGYHTLEQMHSKYGAPKINTIGEDDRAHYEPFTDVMSIPNPTKFNGGNETMDIFLEELAHKVQRNKKGIIGTSTKLLTKDYLNTLKNIDSSDIFTKQGWIDAYEKNYTTPGTIEHEAHSVISPKLKEEYRDIRSKNFDRLYGDMAMGGALPGAVGFTYARTAGSAPANGKYTKKTKASAQNGSVIKDDMGQWAHPGEITEIGSNDITMQGVDYPVLGVSDTGDTQMMYPDQDYKFDGDKVTEFPMAQDGGWLDKYQDGGNINKKLKEEAEERLARMNRPKATISQYTPKPGEQAKFDKQKLERIAEDNAPLNRMAASKGAKNMQDAIEAALIMEGGLAASKLIGKGAKAAAKQTGRIYNTVATGESALPIAWKSPAKGLSQEASDSMFKGIANTNKLSDADRALLLEYQYDSKPFTGRWGKIDQSKRQALNDIIQKNKLNIDNNAILTRKFSPNNKSLGAEFINGRLNLGDRPSSFSAGIGVPSYGSGAVDRLVVPNRYTKQMGNNLLANEYGIPSDKTFDLISGSVKDFAAARGVMADDLINAEREVIGTGLDFKRIGKVKNDIGGYDHIVRPKDATFAKYLTEETPLKNAYKLNPYAFKPTEGMMYRGIGKEGMEDALQSGLFRAKQDVTPTSIGDFNTTRQFSKAYYSPRFDIADYYGKGYIAEVPREASGWGKRYGTKEWSQIAQKDIPITEGKVLQKDWLKRYKEVSKKEDGGWLNKYK